MNKICKVAVFLENHLEGIVARTINELIPFFKSHGYASFCMEEIKEHDNLDFMIKRYIDIEIKFSTYLSSMNDNNALVMSLHDMALNHKNLLKAIKSNKITFKAIDLPEAEEQTLLQEFTDTRKSLSSNDITEENIAEIITEYRNSIPQYILVRDEYFAKMIDEACQSSKSTGIIAQVGYNHWGLIQELKDLNHKVESFVILNNDPDVKQHDKEDLFSILVEKLPASKEIFLPGGQFFDLNKTPNIDLVGIIEEYLEQNELEAHNQYYDEL